MLLEQYKILLKRKNHTRRSLFRRVLFDPYYIPLVVARASNALLTASSPKQ